MGFLTRQRRGEWLRSLENTDMRSARNYNQEDCRHRRQQIEAATNDAISEAHVTWKGIPGDEGRFREMFEMSAKQQKL